MVPVAGSTWVDRSPQPEPAGGILYLSQLAWAARTMPERYNRTSGKSEKA